MIIRELILKNFLVFKDVNRLIFPPPEKKHSSLMLILAPNSGGKTSIIRALEFLIYGRLRRDMPGNTEELINKAYWRSAAVNSAIDCWVQAKIDIGNRTTTVRRRIEGRRGSTVSRSNILLEQIVHTPNGDVFKVDEGRIQRGLEHLVPDSLFDYFYFQGETLAQQLLQGSGSNAIPKGLATLLHEDTWNDARDTADKVVKKLSAEIQELHAANTEFKGKDASRERIREEMRRAVAELRTWKEREVQAKTEFDAAEQIIRNLGGGQTDQRVTEELRRKRSQAQAAELRCGQLDAQIAGVIADSRGLPFFKSAFRVALTELEQMQKENILPADVSEGFVGRLLGGSSCICGRPLSPEAEFVKERLCIEEYRKRTLAVDLNSGLLSLLNRLDAAMPNNVESQVREIHKQVESLLESRRATLLDENDLRDAIRDLEDKRATSNIDAIVVEQSRQRNAHERGKAAVAKQKDLEAEIRSIEMREKQLTKELGEMTRHAAGSQLDKLVSTREIVNGLQILIDRSLSVLKNSFHSILQTSVAKYYDPKATDGSQAHIDPNTLLPQIWRNGKLLHALGGGQRQLLVLAHIISLAELRRDLHAQLDSLGIKTGKLDDQSFVLDSVFAPCDPAYARDVAAFLPGKARQMVILLAKQQWYEEIRKEIEPHVDRVYIMKLHSNNQDRPADEYVFPFKRMRLESFKRLGPNEEPYTKIEEVG